jgi:hypothetical protein
MFMANFRDSRAIPLELKTGPLQTTGILGCREFAGIGMSTRSSNVINRGDLLAILVNFLARSLSYQGDEKRLEILHQGAKAYKRHPG